MEKILPGIGLTFGTGYKYEKTVSAEDMLKSSEFGAADILRYLLEDACNESDDDFLWWRHVDTYLDENTNEWRVQLKLNIPAHKIANNWTMFQNAIELKDYLIGGNVRYWTENEEFVCCVTFRVKYNGGLSK